MPHPWQGPPDWENARTAAEVRYESLLKRLSQSLGEVHNGEHSLRFWRIVIGPWLRAFIHLVWERRAILEEAKSVDPDMILVGPERKGPSHPQTFRELELSSRDDSYNLRLFGQIAAALGIEVDPVVPVDLEHPVHRAVSVKRARSGRQWTESIINILQGGKYQGVLFNFSIMDRFDRLTFSLKNRLKLLYDDGLTPPSLEGIQADGALRRKISRSLSESADADDPVLAELVIWNLPMTYIENFGTISSWVAPVLEMGPKVIGAGYGWLNSELTKFAGAYGSQMGASLVGYQHGGGYGVSPVHFPEQHERTITDHYVTWGWTDREGSNRSAVISPAPVPRMSSWGRSRQRRRRPLFVGYEHPRYPLWILQDPCQQAARKWSDQLEFFENCEQGFLESVKYRHRPAKWSVPWRPYNDSQREAVFKMFPLGQEPGVPMKDDLMEASLIIMNVRSTGYLESLALGIPTVMFWDDEVRDSARALFDDLAGAKILHRDPVSAAEHVNEVWCDPEAWWSKGDVQQARRDFVEMHARVSRDHNREWNRLFRSFIKQSGRQRETGGPS